MKILFVRTGKAYLPEIDAYIKYFDHHKEFQAFDSANFSEYNANDFDIIWEFKGVGGEKKKKFLLVHEYNSISTGIFPKMKDQLKKIINRKPDLRIFLNERVKNAFNFKDNVPFIFRDMGIPDFFFRNDNLEKKEFTFIYVGSISKSRKMDVFLKAFVSQVSNRFSLCLVGNYEQELYDLYNKYENIFFTGAINQLDIIKFASKSEYALNFIPDQYPFNIQTSTKLLEYLALDLKIITTDYEWVNKIADELGCSFYKINAKNPILDMKLIQEFDFGSKADIEQFRWTNVLRNSNLVEKLLELKNSKVV